MSDALKPYRAKRNFAITSEPAEGGASRQGRLAFVIQKHWASRLHYDLRLELGGVMKSWAVPKGPSYDPKDKRMAVQVEDHPIAYNQFEGLIPEGQYGAGKVIIWDEGSWMPQDSKPEAAYQKGVLKFSLQGHKMRGHWALIRMKDRGEKQPPWLLVKEKDEFAQEASAFSVVDEMPDSVVTLRAATTPPTVAKNKGAPVKTKATREIKTKPGTEAALPAKLQPQLATLVDGVPGDVSDWMFEIKYDGYRLLARAENATVQLFTRNGHNWSHKLPHLVQAIGKLPLKSGWLDGEIVVLDPHGIPSFQALQNAFDGERTGSVVFYLFDALFLDGRDLRAEPLHTRRARLHSLFAEAPPAGLRLSDSFEEQPQDLLASACRMGLEGLIGKRLSAPYVSRRSDSWIKLKCRRRQEFVVVGYTDPKGQRVGLGALLLALYDEQGLLQYAGSVGTGFDTATLLQLEKKLATVAATNSPLAGSTDVDRTAHWVKPVLLAEVSFGEWTGSGRIRHAVFHGLRKDKQPTSIQREKAVHMSNQTPASAAKPAGLKVTHAERVIDASTGLNKLDLVRFYSLVTPLLLPHLKHRPVSMVRAPTGIAGELFFQKHSEGEMAGVKLMDPALDPDYAPLMEVATAQAVLSAAQMNVVEFHTWNGVKTALQRPDRMTFDLDPGDGVEWNTVQQAAELVHRFLAQLGLKSFVKTSGGKGLHVVVAIKRQYPWDTVKAFSQAIAQHLADTVPQLFVAKSGPKNRIGKIFVDYLRNGFGATTVAAWSARARPGLGVSVPITWDELPQISSSAHWTVRDIHTRLDQGNKAWDGYAAQSLTPAMQRLGFKASAAEK